MITIIGEHTDHRVVHGDRSKSPTVLAVLLVGGETANPSVQGLLTH